MLGGFVSRLLSQYLGQFLELTSDQLSSSLYLGNLCLSNVPLQPSALDAWDLPIKVIRGTIGKLSLHLSWNNLASKPVCIRIEKLLVICGPRVLETEYDELYIANLVAKAEEGHIASELAKKGPVLAETESGKEGVDRSAASIMTSYAARIIQNIQIDIKDVHVRYEHSFDEQDLPNASCYRRFAIGVSIKSLRVETTDENWRAIYQDTPQPSSFKVASLNSAAAYVHPNAEMLHEVDEAESYKRMMAMIGMDQSAVDGRYVVRPISAVAHLTLGHDPADTTAPKIAVDFEVQEVALHVEEMQYRHLLAFISLFTELDVMAIDPELAKHRPARPQVPVIQNPASWWGFVLTAVRGKVRENLRKRSWASIYAHAKLRNEYVELFVKRRTGVNISKTEHEKLDQYDFELSFSDVLYFRALAAPLVKRFLPNRREGEARHGGGFVQGLFNWATRGWFAPDLPEERLLEDKGGRPASVYEMLGPEGVAEFRRMVARWQSRGAGEPPEYVRFMINSTLHSGTVALLREEEGVPEGGEPKSIVVAKFEELRVDYAMRPDSSRVFVALKRMDVHDTMHPSSPLDHLIAPLEDVHQTNEGRLLTVVFELNPLSGVADMELEVRAARSQLVYKPSALWVIDMFTRPPVDINLDRLQTLAAQQLQTLQQMAAESVQEALQQHRTIALSIDIQAPDVLFPERIANDKKNASFVVARLGHFVMRSENIVHNRNSSTPPPVLPHKETGEATGEASGGTQEPSEVDQDMGAFAPGESWEEHNGHHSLASAPVSTSDMQESGGEIEESAAQREGQGQQGDEEAGASCEEEEGARQVGDGGGRGRERSNSMVAVDEGDKQAEEVDDSFFYDSYVLNMSSMQVWVGIISEAGMQFVANLVDSFSWKLVLQVSAAPPDSGTGPRVKVFASLPALRLHFSSPSVRRLLSIVYSQLHGAGDDNSKQRSSPPITGSGSPPVEQLVRRFSGGVQRKQRKAFRLERTRGLLTGKGGLKALPHDASGRLPQDMESSVEGSIWGGGGGGEGGEGTNAARASVEHVLMEGTFAAQELYADIEGEEQGDELAALKLCGASVKVSQRSYDMRIDVVLSSVMVEDRVLQKARGTSQETILTSMVVVDPDHPTCKGEQCDPQAVPQTQRETEQRMTAQVQRLRGDVTEGSEEEHADIRQSHSPSASPTPGGGGILEVVYMIVARESPMYEGIDQYVDVQCNCLRLNFNNDTIARLIQWGQSLTPPETNAIPSPSSSSSFTRSSQPPPKSNNEDGQSQGQAQERVQEQEQRSVESVNYRISLRALHCHFVREDREQPLTRLSLVDSSVAYQAMGEDYIVTAHLGRLVVLDLRADPESDADRTLLLMALTFTGRRIQGNRIYPILNAFLLCDGPKIVLLPDFASAMADFMLPLIALANGPDTPQGVGHVVGKPTGPEKESAGQCTVVTGSTLVATAEIRNASVEFVRAPRRRNRPGVLLQFHFGVHTDIAHWACRPRGTANVSFVLRHYNPVGAWEPVIEPCTGTFSYKGEDEDDEGGSMPVVRIEASRRLDITLTQSLLDALPRALCAQPVRALSEASSSARGPIKIKNRLPVPMTFSFENKDTIQSGNIDTLHHAYVPHIRYGELLLSVTVPGYGSSVPLKLCRHIENHDDDDKGKGKGKGMEHEACVDLKSLSSMTRLSIRWRRSTGAGVPFRVTVFCAAIIRNHTSLPLRFRKMSAARSVLLCADSGLHVGEKENVPYDIDAPTEYELAACSCEGGDPRAAGVTPPFVMWGEAERFSRGKDLAVRVGRSSGWSSTLRPFSVGTGGAVEVPASEDDKLRHKHSPPYMLAVSTDVGEGKLYRTAVVTFAPHILLHNAVGLDLRVQSADQDQDEGRGGEGSCQSGQPMVRLPSATVRPYHKRTSMLRVRAMQEGEQMWECSGRLPVHVGQYSFIMRRLAPRAPYTHSHSHPQAQLQSSSSAPTEDLILHARVTMAGHSKAVTFLPLDALPPPMRIQNDSPFLFVFSQQGVDRKWPVHAGTSRVYAWDCPAGKLRLEVEVQGYDASRSINPLKCKPHKAFGAGKLPLLTPPSSSSSSSLSLRSPSPASRLRWPRRDVHSSAIASESYIDASGAYVLRLWITDMAVEGGRTAEGSAHDAFSGAKHEVLQGSSSRGSGVATASLDTGQGVGAGKETLRIELALPALGLSVVDSSPTELLYLHLQTVQLSFTGDPSQRTLSLSIDAIQCDNQVGWNQPAAIVAHPTHPRGRRSSSSESNTPCLFASCTWIPSPVSVIKFATVGLRHLDVRLDEGLVIRVLPVVKSLQAAVGAICTHNDLASFRPTDQVQELVGRRNVCEIWLSQMESAGALRTEAETPWHVEWVLLQPIRLTLTFEAIPQYEDSPLRAIARTAGASLGNVDGVTVHLSALLLDNVSGSASSLTSSIIRHYRNQAIAEAYKLVGGLEVIGSPVQLFSNVASGLTDLVWMPAQGLAHSPKDLPGGLAAGVKSAAKKTVCALAQSLGNVPRTLSKGLTSITFDEQFVHERQELTQQGRPRSMTDALHKGTTSVRQTLESGITGIVNQPAEGLAQNGAVGLAGGVLRAVSGLVIKAGVALMDCVSYPLQGLVGSTSDQPPRIRTPRYIDVHRHLVEDYSQTRAQYQHLLHSAGGGLLADDNYVTHVKLDDCSVLVLTERHVVMLRVRKHRPPEIRFSILRDALLGCRAIQDQTEKGHLRSGVLLIWREGTRSSRSAMPCRSPERQAFFSLAPDHLDLAAISAFADSCTVIGQRQDGPGVC